MYIPKCPDIEIHNNLIMLPTNWYLSTWIKNYQHSHSFVYILILWQRKPIIFFAESKSTYRFSCKKDSLHTEQSRCCACLLPLDRQSSFSRTLWAWRSKNNLFSTIKKETYICSVRYTRENLQHFDVSHNNQSDVSGGKGRAPLKQMLLTALEIGLYNKLYTIGNKQW